MGTRCGGLKMKWLLLYLSLGVVTALLAAWGCRRDPQANAPAGWWLLLCLFLWPRFWWSVVEEGRQTVDRLRSGCLLLDDPEPIEVHHTPGRLAPP